MRADNVIRTKEAVRISRLLSLVLRHDPGRIGLTVDKEGWATIGELLDCLSDHGTSIGEETIRLIVDADTKTRFSIDRRRIRANYGHSIAIDLGLKPADPPETLFHGTSLCVLEAIRKQGIHRKNRLYVHLSPDADTATRVARRHGTPVLLKVAARLMHDCGHAFYQTASGVWLTDNVSVEFITFPRAVTVDEDRLRVELLPSANRFFCARQMREAKEFSEQHRTAYGWDDIFVIEQEPTALSNLNIHVSELDRIVTRFLPRIGHLTCWQGMLGYAEAWGHDEQRVLIAKLTEERIVRALCVCLWPLEWTQSEETTWRELLGIVGKQFSLILVNWADCEVVDLTDRKKLQAYLKGYCFI